MSDTKKGNTNKEPQISDKETEKAIPYVPPPPPQNTTPNFTRNPLVNTLGIAVLIVVGGFIAYNYVSQGLTMTAHESVGPDSYQEEVSSITNTPTPSN